MSNWTMRGVESAIFQCTGARGRQLGRGSGCLRSPGLRVRLGEAPGLVPTVSCGGPGPPGGGELQHLQQVGQLGDAEAAGL